MILAYTLISGKQTLALIPEKPDVFSFPIPVESLQETVAGVLRLGPTEALTVRLQEEDLVLEPVRPAKLFITIDLPTMPGIAVEKIKLSRSLSGEWQTTYRQERFEKGEWREWKPLERKE
jgi:hypothetical protein